MRSGSEKSMWPSTRKYPGSRDRNRRKPRENLQTGQMVIELRIEPGQSRIRSRGSNHSTATFGLKWTNCEVPRYQLQPSLLRIVGHSLRNLRGRRECWQDGVCPTSMPTTRSLCAPCFKGRCTDDRVMAMRVTFTSLAEEIPAPNFGKTAS